MQKLFSLKNKKGFTLVEMIVVIVIIAILAAALVTSLIGYVNKAKQTTALVEANNVYVAAQAYISENVSTAGTYTFDPTKDTALIKQVNDYLGSTVIDATKADKVGAITSLITDANKTIETFTYTATNGQTVSYTKAGGWKNS